jgi:excisionase family DNA binding protein
MQKEILTIDEVARMFSVSKRTIYTLLQEKELPGVKIGGQWRFLKKDLLRIFTSDGKEYNKESYNDN